LALNHTIRVRLDDETWDGLIRVTNRRGGNISEYAREKLQKAIEEDQGFTEDELSLIQSRRIVRRRENIRATFQRLAADWRNTGSQTILSRMAAMQQRFPFLVLPKDAQVLSEVLDD